MRKKKTRGMNMRYCVLVEMDDSDERLKALWMKSRFWERLNRLCGHIIILGGGARDHAGKSALYAGSLMDVLAFMDSHDMDAAVHIEPGQLFLDIDLANRAIAAFETGGHDYYTQWEHCRLPAGIGVRIFSGSALRRAACYSVGEFISVVRGNPAGYAVGYDDSLYTSFDRASYDARYSASSGDRLLNAYVMSWDMKGFHELLGREKRIFEKYAPVCVSRPCDERGMTSVYGFESAACAVFPTYLMFDLTNVCNSRCAHCPHSSAGFSKGLKPWYLDFELFKKAIDECRGRPMDIVRLTADGEPLLHGRVVDMVKYASDNGVGRVGLTTNGGLMTGSMAEDLISAGLYMVDFSLDAATPDTYARIRKGLSFGEVKDNIHTMMEKKEKVNPAFKIMVSFVKQRENIDEIDEFIKQWEGVVDKVLIREMISNVNMIEVDVPPDQDVGHRWPCTHLFRRVVISYDGMIKMCPVDWKNDSAYRHLRETSIYAVWHSDFYWTRRMAHLNGRFAPGFICGECGDWKGSPWPLGYEKVISAL